MSKYISPAIAPKPDIDSFTDVMKGNRKPEKVHLCELMIDSAVMKPILENFIGAKWVDMPDKTEYMGGKPFYSKDNIKQVNAWLDNIISFWYHMGYDFVRIGASLPLPAVSRVTADTAKGNESHNRSWQGLGEGVINNWEDFEKYPWPEVSDEHFYMQEYICDHLPEGMGFISSHAGGVYEHTSRLMGYTGLCMNLYDNPELVGEVAKKLGDLIFRFNKRLVQMDKLAAIFQGDDFGFNTQTLIPPEHIRKVFLPWYKKTCEMIHEAGKSFFLHSCGKIDDIMPDLVDDVKIDGKHAFQDDVMPIWEYKKIWGQKIALLGGVDINKLVTMEEYELRKYVRKIIDDCQPGGRFALGSGNSIASYVPVKNYLIMLDEALRY
jgi:uroporphyrinogen decarboxylase